ncbi:uncharacterized protein LOC8265252 isoform X2 [Ricinus communis]|uniref:Transmembrane protein n=1 Tax=Ricinus communis TaxID=3988 RepID=B9R6V7_RICCO|nr:uncharacterized protein LOC8265252 isoform X2 [Ricinus communis]EEF52237.1 conserved hypothetical protein [Ricinus communis]|eukprot:XP_002510050.1 uncharacterized protein LOC8265252 isoform X1 [Ricinus communis]
MLLVSQGAGGGLSARRCTCTHISPPKFAHKKPPLFFSNNATAGGPKFISKKRQSFYHHLTLAKAADGSSDSPTSSTTKQSPSTNNSPPPSFRTDETVFVGQENVPLEGVIQFEKPSSSSRLDKWGRVALISGGDVLALLLFSAIGRFSHGYSVFDFETLRTADPFVAGWFLGAYFLGGYGEDGRGMNGPSKAVIAAVKSWAVGIPLGLIIRAVTSGHIPPYTFVLVTMGSTAVLLVGWRALLSSILPTNESKKNDVYRRGSPFELFELLTSLVRRW